MRVILANTAGFCMGVKRAMEKVLAIARDRAGPIFTYGPLIHNRQVVEMLEARGVCARTDFDDVETGTVLLRTHGVPPEVVSKLRAGGLRVEDGTCPRVLTGQRSIAKHSAEGYSVVIVGDREHDEVAGLAGHAAGPCHVVGSVQEARDVPLDDRILVVAQTTFGRSLFDEIVGVLRARKPDVEVVNSICMATTERQGEARELAQRADAVVVVGGFHSANTRRLAEVARSTGTPTYHVEIPEQLDLDAVTECGTVAVTAGASTPSWITSAVLERLRSVRQPASRGSLPVRLSGGLARLVIDGNLYVAAGAAALTYAVTKLLGLELPGFWRHWCLMAAAFGYIFSAYSLGRRAESKAGGSGVSRRGAFFQAHPRWMSAAAMLFSAVSIAALVPFGWVAVALLAVSYAMALAYAALITSRKRWGLSATGLVPFLRNIPASKDILAAGGWMAVTALVPVVAAHGTLTSYPVALVAGFVFGLAFIRSVMLDFSDVMADRLLGRDTLPALIGPRPARALLAVVACALAAMLAVGTAFGGVVGPRYWILLCPAYILCYLLVFDRLITVSERRCAVVVDGGTLFAGLIALLHSVLW